MRKIGLFLHTTLDGFVGGPNGEMDWININENIFDLVGKFTEKADGYLMGRKTFEMMDAYWPTAGDRPDASKHDIDHANFYNKVPKFIVSKSWRGKSIQNAVVIGENLREEVLKIKEGPGEYIIIFGSPSAAHALMHHDLIDEYGIFLNPVVLGKGIPMFNDITQLQKLKLLDTKTFSSGVNFFLYERSR